MNEADQPTIVPWHDGRDVYVYPNGDRFYVDEVEALRQGAEERRRLPLKVDDLDALKARVERLKLRNDI